MKNKEQTNVCYGCFGAANGDCDECDMGIGVIRMKNKERYQKEIVQIASDGFNIAVSRRYNKPMECASANCKICVFNNTEHCGDAFKEWAESEYIEKPVISKKDKAFLEYIREEFKYITRDDGNKQLFAWSAKPERGLTINEWLNTRSDAIGLYGFNLELPMVKWLDEEPWLIEDLKKLEVVDSYE